ncbi:MAG: hypothetical protein QOJ71_2698, partial [Actinomycetota bacterium]|nr:hypothetical protein [Actinomycetota bacterium]
CGENEKDLDRRFARLRESSPPGVLDGVDLATFRVGRLVGTVEEIREQVSTWEGLGVDTIMLGVGAVPFQVSVADDVELLLETCAPA